MNISFPAGLHCWTGHCVSLSLVFFSLPRRQSTYPMADGSRSGQKRLEALKQWAVPGVSRRIPVESGSLPQIHEAWYLREGRASPEKNLANRFPSLDIPFNE